LADLTQPGGGAESLPDQDVPLLAGVLYLLGNISQHRVQLLVLLFAAVFVGDRQLACLVQINGLDPCNGALAVHLVAQGEGWVSHDDAPPADPGTQRSTPPTDRPCGEPRESARHSRHRTLRPAPAAV